MNNLVFAVLELCKFVFSEKKFKCFSFALIHLKGIRLFILADHYVIALFNVRYIFLHFSWHKIIYILDNISVYKKFLDILMKFTKNCDVP